MGKDPPIIALKNLSFGYGTNEVLTKIDLALKKNGFYLIIGPNGGGKTTLLKLIMGLLEPTKGSVTIEGKPSKLRRDWIGYLPQTFLFDPLFPMSLFEFVLMGALSELTWYGKWPKSTKARALELLEEVEMLPYKDAPIGSLSGGQRQRAGFAKALLSNPKILLLDEPTTGLDLNASHFILEKLRLLKGKMTILMVTHTLPDFLDIVDEALCIQNQVQHLPTNEICSHYKIGIYHPKKGGAR